MKRPLFSLAQGVLLAVYLLAPSSPVPVPFHTHSSEGLRALVQSLCRLQLVWQRSGEFLGGSAAGSEFQRVSHLGWKEWNCKHPLQFPGFPSLLQRLLFGIDHPHPVSFTDTSDVAPSLECTPRARIWVCFVHFLFLAPRTARCIVGAQQIFVE